MPMNSLRIEGAGEVMGSLLGPALATRSPKPSPGGEKTAAKQVCYQDLVGRIQKGPLLLQNLAGRRVHLGYQGPYAYAC